jgi:DNA-binding IclR family transcriptional regulator
VLQQYIATHPGKRANAIAEALDIPLRTVQRNVAKLKQAGVIEFRGSGA